MGQHLTVPSARRERHAQRLGIAIQRCWCAEHTRRSGVVGVVLILRTRDGLRVLAGAREIDRAVPAVAERESAEVSDVSAGRIFPAGA